MSSPKTASQTAAENNRAPDVVAFASGFSFSVNVGDAPSYTKEGSQHASASVGPRGSLIVSLNHAGKHVYSVSIEVSLPDQKPKNYFYWNFFKVPLKVSPEGIIRSQYFKAIGTPGDYHLVVFKTPEHSSTSTTSSAPPAVVEKKTPVYAPLPDGPHKLTTLVLHFKDLENGVITTISVNQVIIKDGKAVKYFFSPEGLVYGKKYKVATSPTRHSKFYVVIDGEFMSGGENFITASTPITISTSEEGGKRYVRFDMEPKATSGSAPGSPQVENLDPTTSGPIPGDHLTSTQEPLSDPSEKREPEPAKVSKPLLDFTGLWGDAPDLFKASQDDTAMLGQ